MAGRRAFVLAFAASTLTACGFELRRAPELRFRTIQLTGFPPRSALAADLRRNIDASTTTHVVDVAKDAEVVLQALEEERQKSSVAVTAANQIREFELRLRFRFSLRTIGGKELIPSTEIVQSRDMSYTERAALGKEQEEATLYRAMQTDIVAQVMRRLASVQAV